jgi:S-formylglutathione hydrolase FrmB
VFAVFLACLFNPQAAQAAGRAECHAIESKLMHQQVPYCVLVPPSYDIAKSERFPVVYFLHGLGGNEQMFLDSGAWNLVEDLWEQHTVGEYLIVAPAGDTSFYINSYDGRRRYEDFFVQEFIPFIEHRYRIRAVRAARGIGGISMGGYGALHIAFRHPELFASVTAHSAALIEKLPTVSSASFRQSPLSHILGGVFGSPPDSAFWDRNSPIALARTAHLAGLHIYFDCGDQDDYGFEAGAAALHKILAARGITHEYHIYPGTHSWGYFAEHLPASLEFQAKTFEPAAGSKKQEVRSRK